GLAEHQVARLRIDVVIGSLRERASMLLEPAVFQLLPIRRHAPCIAQQSRNGDTGSGPKSALALPMVFGDGFPATFGVGRQHRVMASPRRFDLAAKFVKARQTFGGELAR